MRLLLLFCLLFLFSCEYERERYLGTVKDFEVQKVTFSTNVIIILDNDKKCTSRLYQDICIGDSVWDGENGIVWDKKHHR